MAIAEMLEFHIPASITLAQGIIESSCGKSPLATEANNHFGIKCHTDWKGDTYHYDDDKEQECFRKYLTAEQSYRDHSLFLVNRKRYAALFSLDPDDYTGWAMGLKQAGYATNPKYPEILINLIESQKLFLYDNFTQVPALDNLAAVKPLEPGNETSTNLSDFISSNGRVLFRKEYKMPDPSEYLVVRTAPSGRIVYRNNGIPFIFARMEDTWYSIAEEFGIYSSQVSRDNDLTGNDKLIPGQIVYLEPKKNTCQIMDHILGKDETLYSVSQLFGIKLKSLKKLNSLNSDSDPPAGTRLILRKEKISLFYHH
jgi:hypothetical protein